MEGSRSRKVKKKGKERKTYNPPCKVNTNELTNRCYSYTNYFQGSRYPNPSLFSGLIKAARDSSIQTGSASPFDDDSDTQISSYSCITISIRGPCS